MSTIKSGETKKGDRIIIKEIPQLFGDFIEEGIRITKPLTDGITYTVYLQRTNYSRGAYVKNWVYIVKEVSLAEAEKVFNRRKV